MRFPIGVFLSLLALMSVGAGDVRAQAPASGARPPVVLITGSTSGMGRELALEFGAQGATVIVHGRNRADGQAVVAEIEKGGKGHAHFYAADFASLAQVRALADSVTKNYTHLDVLIDNAGVYDPNTVTRTVTPDGNEQAFQVNYLAHVLLTERLKPLLVASAPSRVVIIASGTQYAPDLADLNLEHDYNGSQGYGRSKAADVMYAIDLAAELQPKGVIVNAVHPGTQMDTPMIVSLGRIPVTTIQQGAAAVMNAVTKPDIGSGQLFQGLALWRSPVAQVYDAAFRAQLRTITMTAINGGKIPSAPPLMALTPERSVVGWTASAAPANSYRLGGDDAVAHGGRVAGHLTARTTTANMSANVLQSVRADDYRGKRIRYTAWLRTKDVGSMPNTGVGIWMRVDGNGGTMGIDATQARWLKGTNDWTRMDVVLDVPSGAAGLALGTLMAGGGEAWVDDASITVVDSSVAVTNTLQQPTSNPAQAAAQTQQYAGAPRSPVNLDYEQLGPVPVVAADPVASVNEKAPMTWSGTSTPPEAIGFGLDPQVKHGGAFSGHVSPRAGPGTATLYQSVRAAQYRGKRVRFTAWVRSQGLVTGGGGGARLVLIVAGNGSAMLASDNMQTRIITGTTEWTRYSLVVDVPQAAAAIQIGLAMAGPGETWIDDATFEVVGSDVPVTGTAGPAAAATTQATPNEFLGLPTQASNLDFEKANQ